MAHNGSLGISGASQRTVLRSSFSRKGKLSSVGWPERTSPSQTKPNWAGGMKHRFDGLTRQRAIRDPSGRVVVCPHAIVSTVSPDEVVAQVSKSGRDGEAAASTRAAGGA